MTTLFNDIKYGIRQLRKKPVFTMVAILTLALGLYQENLEKSDVS